MTAYFMQELILEPYAGLCLDTPQSNNLSLWFAECRRILRHAMRWYFGKRIENWHHAHLGTTGLRGFCIHADRDNDLGQIPLTIPLEFAVVGLGVFNGMFAVAAIGSMMTLAGDGKKEREGTRMGLWGAAQAIAAGFGGLLGTILVDMMRLGGLGVQMPMVRFSHSKPLCLSGLH